MGVHRVNKLGKDAQGRPQASVPSGWQEVSVPNFEACSTWSLKVPSAWLLNVCSVPDLVVGSAGIGLPSRG